MSIIYDENYRIIRKKLCSKNNRIVKAGIQDMLQLFENGYRFAGVAKDDRSDFFAFITEILINPDADIRKWLYHLLCLCPLENKKEIITNYCLENIPLELSDDNLENVSWIVAVCGVNCDSLSELGLILQSHSIYDYLSTQQIQFSTSAFRTEPFFDLNRTHIISAIDDLEPISPIWITKMFANRFLLAMKTKGYVRKHGDISTDTFVKLLEHPDPKVRKYTMWAFAQEPNGNMSSILPFIPLSDALSLEAGIQKWYFVKLFQDREFLKRNLDFIQEVSKYLHIFPANVCEGILMGCSKLGYSDSIHDFILGWEQESGEMSDSIQLSLYEYIVTHENKNQDYAEVTKAAIRNIDSITSSAVQSFLRQHLIQLSERSKPMTNPIAEIYAQNVQLNTGGNNTQINNPASNDSEFAQSNQREAINTILVEIEKLKEKIDKEYNYTDKQIEGMIAHFDYCLKSFMESNNAVYIQQIQQLNDKIYDIQDAKPKQRGKMITEFLSMLANITTVVVATPQLIAMINDLLNCAGIVLK